MLSNTFLKYKRLLCGHDHDIETNIRFLKCCVWSALLYSTTWTLRIECINKLESFQLQLFRKILRIPRADRVTNAENFRRMNRNRELLKNIKKIKADYLGHILRILKYELLQLIMQGKVEGGGKWSISRKQLSWLQNIRQRTGIRNVHNLTDVERNRE